MVALEFRLWEKVNGNVTVVALWLTMFARAVAPEKELACEKLGPLAKPVASAVALPGGDTDAAAVARALPVKNWSENVKPGKKEKLVPEGNGPGVTEPCTKPS